MAHHTLICAQFSVSTQLRRDENRALLKSRERRDTAAHPVVRNQFHEKREQKQKKKQRGGEGCDKGESE